MKKNINKIVPVLLAFILLSPAYVSAETVYYAQYSCGSGGTTCGSSVLNQYSYGYSGYSYQPTFSSYSYSNQLASVASSQTASVANAVTPGLPRTGGGGMGFGNMSAVQTNIFWGGLLLSILFAFAYFWRTREKELRV